MATLERIQVLKESSDRHEEILTPDALAFVASLHREFDQRRRELLEQRPVRASAIARGDPSALSPEPSEILEGDWSVAPLPDDLQRRRIEITGPTDRKMMINALNADVDVFMADLEDANAPTWANMIGGQVNLKDAVRGTITFTNPDGKRYELAEGPATLMVRARGLHLDEPHLLVDGEPVAGAFVDAGLYLYHNATELVERGTGPYFYLPKLEAAAEAELWDDLFTHAEEELGLEHGTIKATVLIETLPAALEMEALLFALKDHAAGFNAGRWDYIFSVIKTFREDPDTVLPDRAQVTMTVPFMRAYTERLVQVCHKRGAHAIGGMAAFIPSRDPEVNEQAFQAVGQDKQREATDGFDGTWIAHPGLAEVARTPFDEAIGDQPHQKHRLREDVEVHGQDLVDLTVADGTITEKGLRANVGVGIRYLASWLHGRGAAAIFNLMEDTATAEISRSQVWQWVQHGAKLDDGRPITPELVQALADETVAELQEEHGQDPRIQQARELFETVALADDFPAFLTLPGQALLTQEVDN